MPEGQLVGTVRLKLLLQPQPATLATGEIAWLKGVGLTMAPNQFSASPLLIEGK